MHTRPIRLCLSSRHELEHGDIQLEQMYVLKKSNGEPILALVQYFIDIHVIIILDVDVYCIKIMTIFPTPALDFVKVFITHPSVVIGEDATRVAAIRFGYAPCDPKRESCLSTVYGVAIENVVLGSPTSTNLALLKPAIQGL